MHDYMYNKLHIKKQQYIQLDSNFVRYFYLISIAICHVLHNTVVPDMLSSSHLIFPLTIISIIILPTLNKKKRKGRHFTLPGFKPVSELT